MYQCGVVVVDLPLLRVAVEGSDNPISLEKPFQASPPPDPQRHHCLGRHAKVRLLFVCFVGLFHIGNWNFWLVVA